MLVWLDGILWPSSLMDLQVEVKVTRAVFGVFFFFSGSESDDEDEEDDEDEDEARRAFLWSSLLVDGLAFSFLAGRCRRRGPCC